MQLLRDVGLADVLCTVGQADDRCSVGLANELCAVGLKDERCSVGLANKLYAVGLADMQPFGFEGFLFVRLAVVTVKHGST